MDYLKLDPDRYAPKEEDLIHLGMRSWSAIDRFVNTNDSSISILEIGCGSGALLAAIKSFGITDITGIDVDNAQVSLCRSQTNLNIYSDDWLSFLRKSTKTYDYIVALDVLEHIDGQCIKEVLDVTRQKINEHGKLILRLPNPECPFVLPTFYGDLTHRSLITADLLEHLLRQSGFSGEIYFEETKPVNKIKRWLYNINHYLIVKPILSYLYFHFYGKRAKLLTRNIYCCASGK